MKVEPGNILKLFLNFSNFEPQYSYRLYSYKKKSVSVELRGRALKDYFLITDVLTAGKTTSPNVNTGSSAFLVILASSVTS